MRRQIMIAGLRSGLVVAAASAGVLVAFGMGLGRPGEPITRLLPPLLARVTMPGPAGILTGAVALTAASVIWATLFAIVARRPWRPARVSVAAAIFSLLLLVLHHAALPRALRPGYDSLLSTGQLVVLHVAIAAALVLGMRLAPRQA